MMIKRIVLSILVAAVALCPVSIKAQSTLNYPREIKPINIIWSKYLYDSYELAVKYKKPLVVYFYEDDCYYCQMLNREVLSSPGVAPPGESSHPRGCNPWA